MLAYAANIAAKSVEMDNVIVSPALSQEHNGSHYLVAINWDSSCNADCVVMSGMQLCFGSLGRLRSLG